MAASSFRCPLNTQARFAALPRPSVLRPLRLLCFAYDAETGTYTLLTMQLVRLGGALTVVVIGAFLVRAWRRARARSVPI